MGTNLRPMDSADQWIVDAASGEVIGVQTAGQARMLAVPGADPVGSAVDPVTGGIRYVINGPLTSDEWVTTPSVFKLLMNGTGAVTLEARDANGVITAVFSDTLSASVNKVGFPYAGDSAMAVRATFPTTATVQVI